MGLAINLLANSTDANTSGAVNGADASAPRFGIIRDAGPIESIIVAI